MSTIEWIKSNNYQSFNEWHEQNCQSKIPMQEVSFNNFLLTEFNFINVDFSDMFITDCVFKNVNFWASDLKNTQFINCHFISCCFGTPELINAKATTMMKYMFTPPAFDTTQFIKSNFLYSTFRETDLVNTVFEECILEKCDLRRTFLGDITDNASNWVNNIS